MRYGVLLNLRRVSSLLLQPERYADFRTANLFRVFTSLAAIIENHAALACNEQRASQNDYAHLLVTTVPSCNAAGAARQSRRRRDIKQV